MEKTSFLYGKTEVLFASGFKQLSDCISSFGKSVLWVFDSNTARMVRPLPEPHIILEPGESSKNLRAVESILTVAHDEFLDNQSYFLAFGGGNICDITSVASSMYMGGSKLVLVPTTLLAMTQASFGVKPGINFKNHKNLISTSYSANQVIICEDLLQSLSDLEFSNGLSYLLKTAFTTDSEELRKVLLSKKNKIISKDKKAVNEMLFEAIKARLAILNSNNCDFISQFGLCFANTLEKMKNINCTHGQAVCWGVCKAAELSSALNLCSEKFSSSIISIYSSYGFNTQFRINRTNWLQFYKTFISELNNSRSEVVLIKDYSNFVLTKVDEEVLKNTVLKGAGENELF